MRWIGGGTLRAPREARHGEGAAGVPAPAHREDGRVEHGLPQRLLGVARRDVVEALFEREAVLRAERKDDRVVAGGRLQLEVEADAEALAQREAPGAVDARAEGRVHDELHAARLVEEALEDDVRVGRHEAEGVAGGAQVVDDLDGAEVVEAGIPP